MNIRFKSEVYEWLWEEARKHDMPLPTFVAWYFEQLHKADF